MPEAAAGADDEGGGGEKAGAEASEYRFLGERDARQGGDTQALADATEEQAAALGAQQLEDEAGGSEGMHAEEPPPEQQEEGQQAEEAAQLVGGTANWGVGAAQQAGLTPQEKQQEQAGEGAAGDEAAEAPDEGAATPGGGEGDAALAPPDESFVVAVRLQAASLEDGWPGAGDAEPAAPLGEEEAAALRATLEERLKAASDGASAVDAEAHGREVWQRCEALTAGEWGWLALRHAHGERCGPCVHGAAAQQRADTPCPRAARHPPPPSARAPQAWWASSQSSCA